MSMILFEPGVAIRFAQFWALWFLGYADRALATIRQAVASAREISHPQTLAVALIYHGCFDHYNRDFDAGRQKLEAECRLTTEVGLPSHLAMSTMLLGCCEVNIGQVGDGSARISNGLRDFGAEGAGITRSFFEPMLAEAYGKSGDIQKGLEVLEHTEAFVLKSGERYWEAELHRIRGELLIMQGEAENFAEASYRKAIEIARRQQAKSWELRATTSLSRLLQKQGRKDEARRMLSEIYNWFTEGFDTAGLKDAKALLDSFGRSAPLDISSGLAG